MKSLQKLISNYREALESFNKLYIIMLKSSNLPDSELSHELPALLQAQKELDSKMKALGFKLLEQLPN